MDRTFPSFAFALFTFATVALASLLPPPAFAVEANARLSAAASITTSEVKSHVEVLADDTFEGREAGTRGNRAAGLYIIEELKKYGILPGAEGTSYYQTGPQSNSILGFVPGRDPDLKHEVILVGAHYDHVGYGTARNSYGPLGYIHNGADDNASGVSSLLEVAQALSQLPEKPRRSILLAFWDGEEKGLWGSKYWVEHPTVPLKNLRAAINIDMVGRLRNNDLTIYGVRTAPGLRQLVAEGNEGPLTLDFDWTIKGDSDHYSFYSANIPIVMLHTGLHGDYHRPSDDVEKINNEGLKDVSQLLFNLTLNLAEAPELGKFRSQASVESEFIKRGLERTLPPPKGRLGLRWDSIAARDGRIVVAAVTPGSPADKAGLRAGDRLLSFAGQALNDAEQFRLAVLAAENPVQVTFERAAPRATGVANESDPVATETNAESKPLEVELQLDGPPVRLGIGWREDLAEPGVIIVNRLTPGSPADKVGIRSGDRIYRINGQSFSGGNEFRDLAQSLPDPITLDVETRGKVRSVELPAIQSSAPAAEATPASDAAEPPTDADAIQSDES